MKITDALYGEHGLFYVYMDYLESVISERELPPLPALLALGRGLEKMVVSHATIEDEGLFAALDARLGGAGPLEIMRAEHRQIDDLVASAVRADDSGDCAALLGDLTALLREHFMKEERVLFVLAQQDLSEEVLNGLGDKWAEVRDVAVRGPDDTPGCH